MQETSEMLVQSLGQKDPLEENMTSQFQYSCLENPRNTGAWQATVHDLVAQLCLTLLTLWGLLCLGSTKLLCPWDSPNKNTGVGYHFLLE